MSWVLRLAIVLASVVLTACRGDVPAVSSPSPPPKVRDYPSIFQAWSPIENKPGEDEIALLAKHDLVFSSPEGLLGISWQPEPGQAYVGLATRLNSSKMASAAARRRQLLARNPNILLLAEVRYHDAKYVLAANESPNWWENGYYPPDSPYWLRDEKGQPVISWGEDTNGDGIVDEKDSRIGHLIDFTNEEVQDLVVAQALALKKSGLFDGIMLDFWNEYQATTGDTTKDFQRPILSSNTELSARLEILKKIREKVGDDFLILVNSNYLRIPRSAPYVNGVFLECFKNYDQGYTVSQLKHMEKTLSWAEENLKEPRINCLEGWRVVYDLRADRDARVAERDSEENQRWMRLITTLSLTHSDGYVLFGDDNAIPIEDHLHNWYDFWDAPLGQPVSGKAEMYANIEGLFLREFTGGWAVYNRSGSPVAISFSQPVTGVHSQISHSTHTIADMDGEIYLK